MNETAKVPGLLGSAVNLGVPDIKPAVDLMGVAEGEVNSHWLTSHLCFCSVAGAHLHVRVHANLINHQCLRWW